MALCGTAFLAIWHGLKAGAELEFEKYHTSEHMPERLGIPGFLRGRRYINWQQKPHVCFTMYEAAHAETFRSPGYLARLNAPTPWTQRVQPSMSDFVRGACETMFSVGSGVAGAIATIRITAPGAAAAPDKALMRCALAASELSGVTGIHLAHHQPEITSMPTGETALRPVSAVKTFDYLLLVEALDQAYLQRESSIIRSGVESIGGVVDSFDHYALSYLLTAPKA